MYYLQRTGTTDQEGPYSYEYILRMARENRLNAQDLLIPVDGTAPFHAFENLEFGLSAPIEDSQQETYYPPATPLSAPSEPPKVATSSLVVIAAVVVASLCCIPGFFMMKTGSNAMQGELSGVESVDAITALNQVTRAAINYCNDHDGFFPSGMDSTLWKDQLKPYLPANANLEVGKDLAIEANPNLSVIRQGSVIDPRQTLMFYIRKPVLGDQSAVSNVAGESGYVSAEGLERSITRNIYNVPFDRGSRRAR